MIPYPLIIALFHLDHAAFGVFLGGTIHDVAQVVGAGFSVSDETGNVATFTNLLGVAMLLPVVVALSFVYQAHNTTEAGRRLPGFLIVFAVLVVVNGLGVIPAPALVALKSISRWLLGDGYRRAWDEDVAQGHGGSWRAGDRSNRCRNGLSCDAGADNRRLEIL
jgi:uncharacterized membrane protein YadS